MKSQWVCDAYYKQECLNIGKELESYSIPNILNSQCNICNNKLGTYCINNEDKVEAIEFGLSQDIIDIEDL